MSDAIEDSRKKGEFSRDKGIWDLDVDGERLGDTRCAMLLGN